MSAGLTFIYRSHYEGIRSIRVTALPHEDLLAWFREGWAAEDPRAWVDRSLGGSVYGLASAFERAKEHEIPPPNSYAALAQHLQDHLYFEGDLRQDEHSLRVLTDDDEVALAYFFFDAAARAEHADALAYLLHESWPLPADHCEDAFEPDRTLTTLRPAGEGEGQTYVVLGTFRDSDSLPGASLVLPGVRMPELTEYLRQHVPLPMPPTSWGYEAPWPMELRLLRGLVHEGESTLGPALERLVDYPIEALGQGSTLELGVEDHAGAVEDFREAAGSLPANSGDASLTRVQVDEHIVQVAQHVSKHFGWQQWTVFDDRWAAAHPVLARALLQFGCRWDPLA